MASHDIIQRLLVACTADIAFATRTHLGLPLAGAEPDGTIPRGRRQRCVDQSVGHAGVGLSPDVECHAGRGADGRV